MNWADDVTVGSFDGRSLRARIGPAWNALQGVNGGMVAAIAVEAGAMALEAAGADPAGTPLRAATFGYVNGTVAGEIDVDVDVVRRGRGLITSHVRVVQDGRTTMVGRLHHAATRDGVAFHHGPDRPDRPAGTVPLRGDGAAHFDRVETWLHPGTPLFGGIDRAEWTAWSRPLHGGGFDTTWLTMFGDYLPPAVFARSTGPSRAVTVEYAIQIHLGTDRWALDDGTYLATRVHAFHAHDGFAVEDGTIWLPDGTLLATTRQTRLAG